MNSLRKVIIVVCTENLVYTLLPVPLLQPPNLVVKYWYIGRKNLYILKQNTASIIKAGVVTSKNVLLCRESHGDQKR